MRRLALLPTLGLLALAACSKPADKPAVDMPAVAPTPPAKPAPMAFVTVIYNTPKSASAFEKYYWTTHVPLVGAKQAEVGFVSAELTRFDATLDGKKPTYYRQEVLWFTTLAELEKGIATPAFKEVGDDLPKFATGGLTALVGEEASDHAALLTGDTTAFVTMIYNQPRDAAAFEAYYAATHRPLVVQGAAAIGFTRAEWTRYTRNMDGSPPAFYRQAKLYFQNAAALKAGTGAAEFKAVGDDLPKFADGGLTALVGHLTSKP
jgi:uncharacterized protein (TIGR02118 family)